MEHDKLFHCAFQALKVGSGSEDAGSERKGVKSSLGFGFVVTGRTWMNLL